MSDDYLFDDDLVLDEDALAILDAEESKYLGTLAHVQSNPHPAPTQPTPPPAKRQRTDDDGGWKPTTTAATTGGIGGGSSKHVSQGVKRSDSFYEDLPNISLAGDGVYDVYSQGSQPAQNSDVISSGVKNVGNPLGQRSQPGGLQQFVLAPAPLLREQTSSLNPGRQPPRPPPQRTLTPPSNVLHNPNNSNRPQPQQQTKGQVPRTTSVPPQPDRLHNVGPGRNLNLLRQQPQNEARRFTPAQPLQSRYSNVGGGAPDKDLQEELVRLRAQLEQVRGTAVLHTYHSIFLL